MERRRRRSASPSRRKTQKREGHNFADARGGMYERDRGIRVESDRREQDRNRGDSRNHQNMNNRKEVHPNEPLENGFPNRSARPKKPCWAWEKGHCNRGENCNFSHEGLSDRQDNWDNLPRRPMRNDDGHFMHNQQISPPRRTVQPISDGNGNTRVFVGNLGYQATSVDLANFMGEAGPITFAEVFQDGPGRSKGCGVVQYKSLRDADWAIQHLHDSFFHGRKLLVRAERFDGPEPIGYERPSADFPPSSRPYPNQPRGDETQRAQVATRVYVGNMDYIVTSEQLRTHMEKCGKVKSCFIIGDRTGKSKGCAVVEFSTSSEASKAIKDINDSFIGSRRVFVREDRELNLKRPPPIVARPPSHSSKESSSHSSEKLEKSKAANIDGIRSEKDVEAPTPFLGDAVDATEEDEEKEAESMLADLVS